MKRVRLLKIMEKLDWEYDAESKLLKEYYGDVLDTTYQELARYKMNKGTLLKLDMEKKEMVVRGKVSMTDKKHKDHTEDRDHVIHFGDHPRVMVNGRPGGNIADLKEGETVNVHYRLKIGTADHKILHGISKDSDVPSNGNNVMFLYGKITAIDLEKVEYTVVMPKPDPEKGEWKGYKLYEEELKPLGLPEPSEDNGTPCWEMCKKMCYGDEKSRTFTVKIDDAVDFSINGRFSTFDKATVGDRIAFGIQKLKYEYKDLNLDLVLGAYVVKDGPLTGDELIYTPPVGATPLKLK